MNFVTYRVNYSKRSNPLERYKRNLYGWYDPQTDKTECVEDFLSEIYDNGRLVY